MNEPLAAAQRLYDAFDDRDPQAILDALHTDFVGDISAGMPLGVGGLHHGPEATLSEVWGPVFAEYDVAVDAQELLPVPGDRVVALGHYRGSLRSTGDQIDATFAHVLEIQDGRISRLQQITDTASWAPGRSGSAAKGLPDSGR